MYKVTVCEFCRTRKDLIETSDEVFGSIYLCKTCNDPSILHDKREKALITLKKMNEVSKYIQDAIKSN
jgi:hypothetical protein